MKYLFLFLSLSTLTTLNATEVPKTETFEMVSDIDFGFGVNVWSACDGAVVPGRFWLRGKNKDGKTNAMFGYFDSHTSATTMKVIENCIALASTTKATSKGTLSVKYTQTRYSEYCASQFDVQKNQKENQTLECSMQ